jgi:nicotinamidase-related amidase
MPTAPGERVWDAFLTEADRAAVAAAPAPRKGAGSQPILIMCDLYRAAFGDRPLPLLESMREWPASCGLAGWEAMPSIRRLLDEARSLAVPVVHLKGLEGLPGWAEGTPRTAAQAPPHPDRYEIVDELAPCDGEPVLGKVAPSGFWGTPLLQYLNQLRIDTVVIAGEATSGCVRATAVDARTNRFKVLIPEECVFDRHQAPHALNLFDLNQKYADVIALEDVLDYLRRVARSDRSDG